MTVQSPSEEAIFEQASQRASGQQRADFLEQACAGNEPLKQRVLALLAAHDASCGPLDAPPPGLNVTLDSSLHRPGTQIGPYKLIEHIGDGGMGTVWMAQQTEPVRRLVAVKLIKAGMDSAQVIARFEAERQALALMDHPNIARVLDAGTTEAGRPYFVMDLVRGVPITHYCDEQRLTPRQRLELFIPVCQAIQHAHQKGIIHRDLKPSNVLVAVYDGKPVPKVIDFGVAKATGQTLTDKTLVTGFGAIVGTLEYMSPEQAQFNQLDIDTRSDIYSLGVLLYELLTGSPPFSRKELEQAGMLEMLRVIREQEPSKPSMKLSTAEGLPTLAANRSTEPAKLTKLVRGELDWIVMKALEKDRSRRYETANGFAMDVQRYLADEPVQACPPSAGYRLRKFLRRNKAGLAVAAIVLFFLVLLGSGAGWVWRDRTARQAEQASNLERAVERAESLHREGKRGEALAALERAQLLAREAQTAPFLAERIGSLQQLLDAEGRDEVFVAQFEAIRRETQTEVNFEVSQFSNKNVYPKICEALERYGIAVGITPAAAAVAQIQLRPTAIQTVLVAALDECLAHAPRDNSGVREWLIDVLQKADTDPWRNKVRVAWKEEATSEALIKETDVRQQPPSFVLRVVKSLPAQSAIRLDLARRVQFAHPGDFWANHQLGWDLWLTGKHAEAIRYHTAALSLRPDNPGALLNRANALRDAGELEAAIADLHRAIALAPRYAVAHTSLGVTLRQQGKLEDALASFGKAIEIKPDLAVAYKESGDTLCYQRKLDQATAAYQKAIEIDARYADAWLGRCKCWMRMGRWKEATGDAVQAAALKPDDGDLNFVLAACLLLNGDGAGYRAHCSKASSRFELIGDNYFSYIVARMFAIDPDAVELPPELADLVQRKLAGMPVNKGGWLHIGALENYRARRYGHALTQLEAAAKNDSAWDDRTCLNSLLTALVHQRLGRNDEAQAHLRNVKDRLAQGISKPGVSEGFFPAHIVNWLECQILLREAEALISHEGDARHTSQEKGRLLNDPRSADRAAVNTID